MTSANDNQTIELLRELLDERCIEYEESQDRFCTKFRFNYCESCGDYHNEIEVMGSCITASKSYQTPEQAIAATLGSGTCAQCAIDMGAYADSLCDPLKERINELLRCLENDWHISASWDGLRKFWCIELTEEGVKLRDAVHGTLTAEQVREAVEKRFDFDVWVPPSRWQAIADELNAELENTQNMELQRWNHILLDAPENQLFVLDEDSMRRLYHIGFMDCKEGQYNIPAHGLNNIEYIALSDYESKRQYRNQQKRSMDVDFENETRVKVNELTSESDVPKPAESGEIDISKDDMRDFNDSHEKLEADVRRLSRGWSDDDEQEKRLRTEVEELLDRRAAITERGMRACLMRSYEKIATLQATRYDLETRNRKLQAKVDELNAELQAKVSELKGGGDD